MQDTKKIQHIQRTIDRLRKLLSTNALEITRITQERKELVGEREVEASRLFCEYLLAPPTSKNPMEYHSQDVQKYHISQNIKQDLGEESKELTEKLEKLRSSKMEMEWKLEQNLALLQYLEDPISEEEWEEEDPSPKLNSYGFGGYASLNQDEHEEVPGVPINETDSRSPQ